MLIILVFLNLIMKVFYIHTLIHGHYTAIEVQQPVPWYSNEFTIRYHRENEQKIATLLFDNGHWKHRPEELDLRAELEDLEVDSIGHQIASIWSQELAIQLERFQLYI